MAGQVSHDKERSRTSSSHTGQPWLHRRVVRRHQRNLLDPRNTSEGGMRFDSDRIKAAKVLSSYLWKRYEYELPDPPGFLTSLLLQQLDDAGLQVRTVEEGGPTVTPIMRTAHE